MAIRAIEHDKSARAERVDQDQTGGDRRAQHPAMDPLIESLRDPARYPHPAAEVAVIETHISWVLLAGRYAYKIKKPVRLPFLDFSTLELRRHFCEEELRLNRRTAPELYLRVVPIARAASGPAIDAPGDPIEYAVQMKRFARDALADTMARGDALGPVRTDAIADALAAFHARAPRAGIADGYGGPAEVAAPALGNFEQLAELPGARAAAARLERLRAWTARQCAGLAGVFTARLAAGCVRECHGDLHLGNIAFIGERAVPFDCIEFDPALRWIDVASEVAFVVMDLRAHGLQAQAWRLLNRWLERTGDYDSMPVLRLYLVYRAMVRAKVACLRGAEVQFQSYLALAESLAVPRPRSLVLMHGVSGSGRTTLAEALLERFGAIRVRSDVERKRLHGLEARARMATGPDQGIYDPAASGRTYGRLAGIARGILEAGYPAIVDAAFLRLAERERFRGLARELEAQFLIVSSTGPADLLRRRVARRKAEGSDASDAGESALASQVATREPLTPKEEADAVTVEALNQAALRRGADALAARLAAGAESLALV